MIYSILFILILGLAGNYIFTVIKLPGLLGMIFAGIAIGPYGFNLLDDSIVNNAADIRMIALIIILLRAGLGLDKNILKRVGKVAGKMSIIPCLAEGATVMLIAHLILGFPLPEAGILGFIIAAVSPAVLVPSMLYLKDKMLGMKKGIPVILLAGASVDDVIAITLFSSFLGMAMHSSQTALMQVAFIPLKIAGGVLLGVLFGFIINYLFKLKNTRLGEMERLVLVIAAALSILLIGEEFQLAGLLGVMTLGFVILEKTGHFADILEKGLNRIWFFAQIFLFVLIGAAVNIEVALQGGAVGLAIIAAGLIARSLGVMTALYGSPLNLKEKIFCTVAYSPKATVQAAIGGVPLAMGIESGDIILAIAVLAIVVTAPLGAVGINLLAPRLLEKDDFQEARGKKQDA